MFRARSLLSSRPLRRLGGIAVPAALLGLALGAGSAPAATPAGLDTATATGSNFVVDDFSASDIDVDAQSGPSEEDPGGTVSFSLLAGMYPVSGPVSCLDVSGSTAVMTVDGPFPSLPGTTAFLVRVIDNGGAGQDVFQYFPDDLEVPDALDCHVPSADWFGGKLDGRAVVADVLPPPPAITGLGLSPKSFVASPKSTPLERSKGSEINLTLSEDATVTFKVRRRPPDSSGGEPPRHPRIFKRELERGVNAVPFTGTLGDRTLKPRRYMLLARARDSAGQRSEWVRTGFRVTGWALNERRSRWGMPTAIAGPKGS